MTLTLVQLTQGSRTSYQLFPAAGWARQHVISTVSNAIIEVKACGHQISDEASRIADEMVAKASA